LAELTFKPCHAGVAGDVWGNNGKKYVVKGWTTVLSNDKVTVNGAKTGAVFDNTVSDPGPFCGTFSTGNDDDDVDNDNDDTVTYCHLGALTKNSSCPTRPGDSGGPVFVRGRDPNITAVGTVTGGDAVFCYYTRIQQTLTLDSLRILTG
jgi:hypothetical protein